MARIGTLLLSVVLLAVTTRAFAITIGDHVTTADPLVTSGCTVPVAKTSFSPDDERAYVWIEAVNAAVGDVVDYRWFDPQNTSTPRYTAQFTFNSAGNGCSWAWIVIRGQAPATLPGQWRVEVYLNGALGSTNNFTIAGGPPPPPQSAAGAAHLEFFVNDQLLVPWTHMDVGYRIKSFQPGLRVDLYLALVLDDAGQCISPDRVFVSVPPHVADLPLENTQGVISAGHLPGRVLPVGITVYGVLVGHGVSPGDPANWISNLATLDLLMGTLSSRQAEVLAERGNPKAYIIQFFYDTEQRIETWRYDGGGAGQVFQFINGRPLSRGDDGERASANTTTPATFYGPGQFGPGTTPAEIRALLGDPDRVVSNSPGTQAWVFKGSGITVTVANGVIRQIVAH